MRILIDILHPAHVHFFRNFIKEMQAKGHQLLITARNKDVTLELLHEYDIKNTPISRISKGKIGLAKELLTRTYRLYKICKKFKPNLLMGVMGASTTIVGKLLKIPCLVFYNNENANLTNWYAYPLATRVITSSSYAKKVKGKHITYPGYHELAYLHPLRHQPGKTELPLGNYIIVRFVSWQASHDVGEKGLKDKISLVKELEKFLPVYITSESGVPKELSNNILKIKNKKDIFDIVAGAELIFGEGATMASEAAVLGTPAVYVNSLQLGFLKEQQKDYGLVCNFIEEKPALDKAIELLKNKNSKAEWQKKRQQMLKEKIDVTDYMVNFVEQRTWKN